jgi:very-short-patch-repair endonuclease
MRCTRTSRNSGPTSPVALKLNQGEEAFAFWCKALKMQKPTRNYRFHPKRKFEIDWCWPKLKIGCEIDGGVWTRGAHGHPKGILRDMEKHNLLLDLGWRVWHFTPEQAIDGSAAQHMDKVLGGDDTAVIPPAVRLRMAFHDAMSMDPEVL